MHRRRNKLKNYITKLQTIITTIHYCRIEYNIGVNKINREKQNSPTSLAHTSSFFSVFHNFISVVI